MTTAEAARTGAVLPSPPVETGRLDALDGLRALAVYLVVAFHAGLSSFDGGFVGVDVFFVLSGFLITRLLVGEHRSTGRLSFVPFFARRARRLLPAAWIAMIVTAVAYLGVSTPFERDLALRDAQSAVFYVSNWRFVDQGSDYFAESISSSPFLHLWSLSVEEQFYLVWPFAAWAVLRWWRRAPRAATAGLALSTVLGVWWALRTAETDLLRAYYGTDTRAYQLLAGATLALAAATSTRRPRIVRPLVARAAGPAQAIGLAAVIATATAGDLDPVERGLATTVATLVLLAGVQAASTTSTDPVTGRALGSRPLSALGNISYATYLWHWPIVVVVGRVVELSPRTMFVVVAVTATAIAKLSMDLVERPVRVMGRRPAGRFDVATIGVALVTTVVVGLVVLPRILGSDVAALTFTNRAAPDVVATAPTGRSTSPPEAASTRPGPGTTGSEVTPTETEPQPGEPTATSVPASPFGPPPAAPVPVPDDLGRPDLEIGFTERSGCVNQVPGDVGSCVVVEGAGERILLIGDSHASKLNVAFADRAAATGAALAVVSGNGCPWQDGVLYRDALPAEGAKQACRDQSDALYDRYVDEFDPDVVVIANHDQTTEGYDIVARPERGVDESASGPALIEATARDSVERLAAPGRRIVILEPPPNSPFHPLNCLSAAEFVDDCAFEIDAWPHVETPILRAIAAERPDTTTVDLTDLACPHVPVCRPIVDGLLVRVDLDHFDVRHTLRVQDVLMGRIGI